MQLRSGKYKGRLVSEILDEDPMYINWITENRPEMLKEPMSSSKKPEKSDKKPSNEDIKPNKDFDNQTTVDIDIKNRKIKEIKKSLLKLKLGLYKKLSEQTGSDGYPVY